MFAKPRIKKSALVAPPKRRKKVSAVEEVVFDNSARQEYLTGFHKRKLQRQKVAQEEAAERARQERIELRKQVKADRQRQVEEHVAKVNELLREAAVAGNINGEDDDAGEVETEEWSGINDAVLQESVDMEEEYIDEDRYTSVTVESVAVTRQGLEKPVESDEEETEEQETKAGPQATQAKKASKPKQRKPKFRYETKAERQLERKKRKAKRIARRREQP